MNAQTHITATTRIYAACLASYNAGILHGAWIDATSDEDEMQEAVAAMLAASPTPGAEEWAMHDCDDPYSVLRGLGEYPSLETVAEIMDAIEDIQRDYDDTVLPHLFAWLADHQDDPAFWKSDLDDAFAGIWNDPEDYAAQLAEDCGDLASLPDHLARYIDFQKMARDMALGGEMDFICTSTGQHLHQYDDMRGRECIAMRNL